jgi:fluoroacetyl-CoA-specific thioesterase
MGLEPGATNIRHLAATPIGMRVTFRATLTQRDGRRLLFRVQADDEREHVGEGTHERFVVDSTGSWDASPPKGADPRSPEPSRRPYSRDASIMELGVNGPTGTAFGTSAAHRGRGALRGLSAPRRRPARDRRRRTP